MLCAKLHRRIIGKRSRSRFLHVKNTHQDRSSKNVKRPWRRSDFETHVNVIDRKSYSKVYTSTYVFFFKCLSKRVAMKQMVITNGIFNIHVVMACCRRSGFLCDLANLDDSTLNRSEGNFVQYNFTRFVVCLSTFTSHFYFLFATETTRSRLFLLYAYFHSTHATP